jgi:hypothetical protein
MSSGPPPSVVNTRRPTDISLAFPHRTDATATDLPLHDWSAGEHRTETGLICVEQSRSAQRPSLPGSSWIAAVEHLSRQPAMMTRTFTGLD